MNESKILELYKDTLYSMPRVPDGIKNFAFAENTHCGDEITFFEYEGKLRYVARACSITIASAEFVARAFQENKSVSPDLMQKMLLSSFEMDPNHKRFSCAILSLSAFDKFLQTR